MTAPDEDIPRLLGEARELPDGTAKVELLNEAARIADSTHDVETGFYLRKLIMGSALGGGLPDQMSVAFTWCVSQSDRHPDVIPSQEILWEYRWVISELPHFPQVPRQQIEDTIGEMVQRYRAAGSTLRPVHLLRMFTHTKMGDRTSAVAARRDWEQAGRDFLSDSPRQELNLLVHHLAFAGHYQEAIDRSTSVMTGRVDEPEFFGQDSAELLIPLLELGRVTDGIRVQRSGYRYLSRKPAYLAHMAFHVEFLARLDHFPQAVKVVEEHMPLALATKQFVYRTHFLRSLLLLVERFRNAGHSILQFRFPAGFPLSPSGRRQYDVKALTGWLRSEVADWSNRFDERNGNRFMSEKLAALSELAVRSVPGNN
jgi:hypothetical protein